MMTILQKIFLLILLNSTKYFLNIVRFAYVRVKSFKSSTLKIEMARQYCGGLSNYVQKDQLISGRPIHLIPLISLNKYFRWNMKFF